MVAFGKLQQKSKTVALISKFQNSFAYLLLFALICAVAGVSGKEVYLPCIYLLTALSVLAGIFSEDIKVFFAPAFMCYYAIGLDVGEDYFKSNAGSPTFDPSALAPMLVCGAIILAVLIFRLIADGYMKEFLTKRGISFWGLILLGASLVLGGALSPEWSVESLGFGALLAIFFSFFYMLFAVVLAHSNDGIAYMCKALICMGIVVSLQIIILAYRLNMYDNLVYIRDGVPRMNRHMLSFSWGVATIVGGVMVPPIIAALYMMRNRKYPVLSLVCALFFFGVMLLITTRSAIIMGTIALLAGLVLCFVGGKNKKINRITLLVLLGSAIVGFIIFVIKFPETYESIISKFMSLLRLNADIETEEDLSSFLSQRPPIWRHGWGDFLSEPVLGTGFKYGYFEPSRASANLFINMYHNIFIQVLASMGIVGAICILIHFKQVAEVFFRQFNLDKLVLLMVPICILGMSLVDNFFFYPNFIVVYVAFLAGAEISLEQKRKQKLDNIKPLKKDRKPRVVFTYVEAGKGHIIPTHSVCECFKKKYGDKVEVVESKFFTETGDPNLEKTEKLFVRAVKDQNRSPVMSFLCKLGNLLAGDNFALYVLLRLTVSGRKTDPRAVKHIEELDADVIYTAHWSIPFYVNQIKGPRPYTICFCPDVYSNGAFNVDCNNFLMSSDVGYNRVCRQRMYAGGNVSRVSFPIRPEVAAYRAEGKKEECRAKLGIPEDEFVVVLCDGGYGMARLEKTVMELARHDKRMTVIALCGTNHELYERLCEFRESAAGQVRLIPVDFTDNMLEYLACADIFVGKSGANSIAEPASLNIPIIVTKCITYIEKGIKNYYVRNLKGAMYIPNSRVAANRIVKFAENPELLEYYRKNLRENTRQKFDAEDSADLIWQRINEITE